MLFNLTSIALTSIGFNLIEVNASHVLLQVPFNLEQHCSSVQLDQKRCLVLINVFRKY